MFCKNFLHTGGIAEADMCSMDSYIEQTDMKLQTNIVSDIKREIDSLSLKVGTLNSHLANFLIKSEGEILRELDELESNIGEELDKLHGQKCSCTCSGTDYITLPTEKPIEQQCGGAGWRRVADLNMRDPDASCPKGWRRSTIDNKRVCGRSTGDSNACYETIFPVDGEEYSRVCGQIKAYQFEALRGFLTYPYLPNTIEDRYADGVSLTHGKPRQHIWTFVGKTWEGQAEACPCDLDRGVPDFVGKDYFCEAGKDEGVDKDPNPIGFLSNDPLWDGKDCSASPECCSFNNPPYFFKELEAPTTDSIQARICLLYNEGGADIMVEEVELYVQ